MARGRPLLQKLIDNSIFQGLTGQLCQHVAPEINRVTSETQLQFDHPERLKAIVSKPSYTLAQREHVSWEGEGELALFRLTASPPAVEQVLLESWTAPRAGVEQVTWAVDDQGVVTSSAGARCTYDEGPGTYACE